MMKFITSFSLLLITSFYVALLSANDHPLTIEVDWLQSHLEKDDVRIIDVRPQEEYLKAHLPNAVNLPFDTTFDTGVRHSLLAPISVINKRFNKAGIRHSLPLILYDNGSLLEAARLFWVLEVFGHHKVSILNGGLNAWEKAGNPITKVIPTIEPSNFIGRISPQSLATTFSVQMILHNPDHTLLDVRSKKEYEGLESKTEYFGHIPQAVNIPISRSIDPVTQKLRPLAELEKIYQELDVGKPVTAYCNRGRHSALTYFVLRNLNFSVNAYDGSWIEWSRNPNLPRVLPLLSKKTSLVQESPSPVNNPSTLQTEE
jgi:thiosulfate/3-mercaptopyruvate sulfurtransferase